MPVLATKNPAPTVVSDAVELPPKFPDLPDDVLKRFPSLEEWEEDTTAWWNRAQNALQTTNHFVSQSVTSGNQATTNLRSQFGAFTAAIDEELSVITDDLGAQAKRIVTVSAMAGVSQNIKVQTTPPGSPVLNDIWINTSDPLTPVTYAWSGVDWAEVTEPISAAAVADERTARVTADGFLSGNYALTVVAGNVVTGMTITSSTGPGATVSQIIFQADKFQIWNGSSGQAVFDLSGASVRISGWTLNATTLSGGNAVLDSAGTLLLGTGSDVAILSASDATYRLWIGNPSAGSAAFTVTKAGVMAATGGSFSGSITSISGSIGGFTLAANALSSGGGPNAVYISAIASTGITVGDSATLRVSLLAGASSPGCYVYNSIGSVVGILGYSSGSDHGYVYVGDSSSAHSITLFGDTSKISLVGSGSIVFDSDTNLYRVSANSLKTDDAFTCAALTVNGHVITVSGVVTLNDWFDQAVKTTSSPQFAQLNIGGMANGLAGNLQVAGASGVNHGIQFNGATNAIAFYWDSGAGLVKVYVDGSHQVME